MIEDNDMPDVTEPGGIVEFHRRVLGGWTPVPDVPMLRKLAEHITANPEEHDQADWRTVRPFTIFPTPTCGTVMCAAGWVVELSGARWAAPADSKDETRSVFRVVDLCYPNGGAAFREVTFPEDLRSCVVTPDGLVVAGDYAQAVLGLGRDEANELFYNADTREEALDVIRWIIERAELAERRRQDVPVGGGDV